MSTERMTTAARIKTVAFRQALETARFKVKNQVPETPAPVPRKVMVYGF
jgi:hypothetical protein